MTGYSSTSRDKHEAEKKLASFLTVVVLIAVVIFPHILVGFTVAFPAIAIPQMKLSIDFASWFASVGIFFSPIGGCIIGYTIENCGKRSARLLGIIPCVVGWILLCNFSHFALLLTAQVLIGLTFGAIIYPSQIYSGECIVIHSVKLRNYFAKSTGLINAFGVFVTFVLGYYASYRTVAKVAGLLALLSSLMIFFFIPKSAEGVRQPLLKKTALAGKSSEHTVPENVYKWTSMNSCLEKLKRRDVYLPLYSLSVTFLLSALSGAITMMTYMVDILGNNYSAGGAITPRGFNESQEAKSTLIDASYKYSIVTGGLILLANIIVSATLVFVRVKRMNVIAQAGACIGMVLIGYTSVGLEPGTSTYNLHILGVCLVNFMFNFGPLNIVREILKDAFPSDATGFAAAVSAILPIFGAVMNKLYPYLFFNFGGYLYYGYSVLCAINAIFCFVYLPEIEGATLDAISEPFLTHE